MMTMVIRRSKREVKEILNEVNVLQLHLTKI